MRHGDYIRGVLQVDSESTLARAFELDERGKRTIPRDLAKAVWTCFLEIPDSVLDTERRQPLGRLLVALRSIRSEF